MLGRRTDDKQTKINEKKSPTRFEQKFCGNPIKKIAVYIKLAYTEKFVRVSTGADRHIGKSGTFLTGWVFLWVDLLIIIRQKNCFVI